MNDEETRGSIARRARQLTVSPRRSRTCKYFNLGLILPLAAWLIRLRPFPFLALPSPPATRGAVRMVLVPDSIEVKLTSSLRFLNSLGIARCGQSGNSLASACRASRERFDPLRYIAWNPGSLRDSAKIYLRFPRNQCRIRSLNGKPTNVYHVSWHAFF